MCGIAGLYRFNGSPVVVQEIENMIDTLRHRGPDDQGVYVDGTYGCGMRRLSIIDLSTGAQPMISEDGSIAVVFNGEIYNYLELKRDLSPKHRFMTTSDTEVLIHLYEDLGPSMVSRLRGMFAIALWDSRARRLLLARDRVGKKPLYLARSNDGIAFASEIKALLAMEGTDTSIDATAIYQYLGFGFVPRPRTAYRGIEVFPPGHYATVDAGGQFDMDTYWCPSYEPKLAITFEEAASEAERLIQEAVAIRLRSDVPIGVFLSGGIDSGLVTAMAATQSTAPIRTFSMGFTDSAYDETPLARLVAERYGTIHNEVEVDLSESARRMEELLPRLVDAYDQPFADSSAIPSYLVSQQAGQHVKVILNGDGGDETFAGYRRYSAAVMGMRFAPLRPAARLVSSVLPVPPQRRGLLGFSYRLLHGFGMETVDQYIDWTALRSDSQLKTLFNPERLPEVDQTARSVVERYAHDCARYQALGALDRMMCMDLIHILPDDLLVKMDIATMANSVEGRSPLLDHELIEFAARLPESVKCLPRTTKPILRRIAKSWLPNEVAQAPKRGFEVPMARWLRSEMKLVARDILLSPASRIGDFVQMEEVRRMLDDHQSGHRDWAWQIWSLLFMEAWLAKQSSLRQVARV